MSGVSGGDFRQLQMAAKVIGRAALLRSPQIYRTAFDVAQPPGAGKNIAVIKPGSAHLLKIIDTIEPALHPAAQGQHRLNMVTGRARIHQHFIHPGTTLHIPPIRGRGQHGQMVVGVKISNIAHGPIGLDKVTQGAELDDQDIGHQYAS